MQNTATYYPLGYPLELTTNSADVLEAAQEDWGECQQLFSAKPVRLCISVEERETPILPGEPVFQAKGNIVSIECGGANSAACDLVNGRGTAQFAAQAVRDHDWLRYHFLEAMAYSMIDAAAFTAVHAACVALNGKGVLLSGDSGAGKSTLPYACARQGWTFVSDDASHLVRGGNNVVTGAYHRLRLREPARSLFSELRGREPKLRPNGKWAIEIRTADLPGIVTAARADVHAIVFLNRGDGEDQLRRLSPEEARHRPLQILTAAEGDILEAQLAALRKLALAPVFELSYQQPEQAVERLSTVVHSC